MGLWDGPERATIADLEVYGLTVRTINMLEERFGAVYVDELEGLSLRGVPYFGVAQRRELREALSNWRAGRRVRSEDECVGGDDVR